MEMACLNNGHQVGWSWANHWPGIQASAVLTIILTLTSFKEHGTSANLNEGNSGRLRAARSADIIQRVRWSPQRNGVDQQEELGLAYREVPSIE